MKRKTVSEIKENESVESTFFVKSKSSGTGRTGKPYLSLVLMDATGEVEARIWDDALEWDKAFREGDFIVIRAKVVSYQGRRQVNISELRRCSPEEVTPDDFFPSSRKNLEELFRELQEVIRSVRDPHLRELLELIFSDPDISRDFQTAPAAKSIHHVFRGGLLEHTLSVAKMADRVVAHYQDLENQRINRDLLVAGALLHDIGKIREISPSAGFPYTTEGRLIGHIVLGAAMVRESIRAIEGFPGELETLLLHMLISHHGLQEYGSPQPPMTLEAMVLYYLDDIDSKIESITTLLDSDSAPGEEWTPYHRSYQRFFFKGKTD